jgi:hypothetical protein
MMSYNLLGQFASYPTKIHPTFDADHVTRSIDLGWHATAGLY